MEQIRILKKKFTIYQMDIRNEKAHGRIFARYDENDVPTKDLYKEVYTGEMDDMNERPNETLERIYIKFNVAKPEDFHGHSLSVSDVILLDGQHYYVDSLGYKKIW